ncbi:MAG: hypothetical protein IT371_04245 [Deltaproteobacteria bacterium]|nr:hypothetical protein [Deltaproteobacteria bacterium]
MTDLPFRIIAGAPGRNAAALQGIAQALSQSFALDPRTSVTDLARGSLLVCGAGSLQEARARAQVVVRAGADFYILDSLDVVLAEGLAGTSAPAGRGNAPASSPAHGGAAALQATMLGQGPLVAPSPGRAAPRPPAAMAENDGVFLEDFAPPPRAPAASPPAPSASRGGGAPPPPTPTSAAPAARPKRLTDLLDPDNFDESSLVTLDGADGGGGYSVGEAAFAPPPGGHGGGGDLFAPPVEEENLELDMPASRRSFGYGADLNAAAEQAVHAANAAGRTDTSGAFAVRGAATSGNYPAVPQAGTRSGNYPAAQPAGARSGNYPAVPQAGARSGNYPAVAGGPLRATGTGPGAGGLSPSRSGEHAVRALSPLDLGPSEAAPAGGGPAPMGRELPPPTSLAPLKAIATDARRKAATTPPASRAAVARPEFRLFGGKLQQKPTLRLALGFGIALLVGAPIPILHARSVVSSRVEPLRVELATAIAHRDRLMRQPNYRAPAELESEISSVKLRSGVLSALIWAVVASLVGLAWFRFS